MQYKLKSLDYHIIDACDRSCNYCSHYSNFTVPKNLADLDKSIEEWTFWSQYLRPDNFILLGGEPTLHPQLIDFILAAKTIWSGSNITLISNGLHIDKFHRLEEVLQGHTLRITIHDKGVKGEELRQRCRKLPINVVFNETVQFWSRWYKINERGEKEPFQDNNQRASWESCIANKCHVLRDNSIWKCPQTAYASTVGITWFNYKPLTDPKDLKEWLEREDEYCCSNCPATHPQLITLTK